MGDNQSHGQCHNHEYHHCRFRIDDTLVTDLDAPSIDFIILPFSLFIYPMFLFAGTFFPVSALPEAGQWIAMCVPLTHATVLTRAVGLGIWTMEVWISVAYIAAMVVITVLLGTRLAQRRIMR